MSYYRRHWKQAFELISCWGEALAACYWAQSPFFLLTSVSVVKAQILTRWYQRGGQANLTLILFAYRDDIHGAFPSLCVPNGVRWRRAARRASSWGASVSILMMFNGDASRWGYREAQLRSIYVASTLARGGGALPCQMIMYDIMSIGWCFPFNNSWFWRKFSIIAGTGPPREQQMIFGIANIDGILAANTCCSHARREKRSRAELDVLPWNFRWRGRRLAGGGTPSALPE